MSTRLGFIGLGLMGKPMARHLLIAGYPLMVCNRSRSSVDELVADGAGRGESPRQVAEQSEIVITMLPDTADVESVVLESEGILEGKHEGLLVIDMSTISPEATQRMAATLEQQGVGMLDAPVSGGDVGAKAATLSIMVGGMFSDFERARPVLGTLGKTITYCGSHGMGQVVKACNQVVVALVIAAISEGLVLGAKAGVDPEILLRVLSGGLAQSRVMDLRGATMIQHQFAPGGKARFHRKDLAIALQLARNCDVALPLTAIVDQLFTTLVAHQQGELDHSALLTVLERLANYSLAPDQVEREHL
jgi:2-hydroxy-3-oxopropionate reductase